MDKNLLLLHCCCAPCAGGCITHPFLDEQALEVAVLYFSNSNIDAVRNVEKITGKTITFYEGDVCDKDILEKI